MLLLALEEYLPYLAGMCLYVGVVSLVSAYFEKVFGEMHAGFWKLAAVNAGVSFVGLVPAACLWFLPTRPLTENALLVISPFLVFLAVYFLKVRFSRSFGSSPVFRWLTALIHPLILCALPVAFVWYLFALASAYRH